MHYEINVSKNGRHFFATHERSITTKQDAKKVLDIFEAKFPEEEGYFIMVLAYDQSGIMYSLHEFKEIIEK